MTLLIALIGLLATVYAVLPRERQLELRLRLTVVDVVSAAVAFALILYCEYYPFFLNYSIRGVRLGWRAKSWPPGLDASNVGDLVVILWATVTAVRMRLRRLSRRNIGAFREILDELYWAGGYEEILNFLERHHRALFRVLVSDSWVGRLRKALEPVDRLRAEWLRIANELSATPVSARIARPLRLRSLRRPAMEWLSFRLAWLRHILPDYAGSEEEAQSIINNILLSEQFVSQLVVLRPYLAISLVTAWPRGWGRLDFIQLYLWKLMDSPSSSLYTELRNNQNLGSGGRYRVPASNRLLHFFLSDARVAKDNSAYKPIGDYVLELLDNLCQDPVSDPYNRALGYFAKRAQWESPLYVAIHFFDVMVEEALHQNIEWHMWLYYMPPIVEKMARNCRVNDPLSNPANEFPNRYCYLIYEIFSRMERWIKDASEVPDGQANVVLGRVDCQHENGNIPKSSIRALCEALFSVVVSDQLTERTINDRADGVFELFFDIRVIEGFRRYAAVLLLCLQAAGKYSGKEEAYADRLRAVFSANETEYLIKHDEEYVNELRAALDRL